MIISGPAIIALLVRYNGIGKPLDSDEREIVLFALYNESEARAGIAKEAQVECERIASSLRIVKPKNPPGSNAVVQSGHNPTSEHNR